MSLGTVLSTTWEAHYVAIILFLVLATVFAIYTRRARQPLDHAQTTRIYKRMLEAHNFRSDCHTMVASAYQIPARVLRYHALTSKGNLAFLFMSGCFKSSRPRPASEPYMLLAKGDTGYRLVLGLWQDILMEGEEGTSLEAAERGFAERAAALVDEEVKAQGVKQMLKAEKMGSGKFDV
jgi:hypothetical protein